MRKLYYLLLPTMLFTTASAAQEGQLDLSFGTDGMAVLSIDTLTLFVSDMVVQNDGKIVTTGRCYTEQGWDIYVIRCLPDGELDPAFGSLGVVRTDLGSYWDQAFAVTIQDDDKILVAAESSSSGLQSTVTLVRYHPDGALDETFGAFGVATAVPNAYGHPLDLFIKDGGEILVVGTSAYYNAITLYQFTSDGSPDNSFQLDGSMTISPFSGTNVAHAVQIQNDGKALLACLFGAGGAYDVAVIRLLPDGSFDTGFGNEGIVTLSLTPGDETIGGMGIQSDGSIVITGATQYLPNYDMFAARFTPSGALDEGFGTGGIVVISTSIGSDRAHDLVIQPDDAVLITGGSGQVGGLGGAVAVVRLTPDGSLDPVFGDGGIVRTSIPNASQPAGYAVDLQPDGRVIVAAGGAFKPVLLRYKAGPFAGLHEYGGLHEPLTAFPNPTSGLVSIGFILETSELVILDVVDAMGRVVIPGVYRQILPPGSHHAHLDLGQLVGGVYSVRLHSASAYSSVQVIAD
ncbi:MAG: hypothetical protein KF905_04055 [Flavobacteriales bacterium]|nr:hypothetical protein [Flavobacteriales bacterium]